MSVHSPDEHAIAVIEPHWAVRWIRRLGRRFERSLRLGVRAAGRGFVEFYNSDDLTFAASIAYYSLLSIFPFSLLVLAVLSHITVGETGATLLQLLTTAVPGNPEFLTQITELGHRAL